MTAKLLQKVTNLGLVLMKSLPCENNQWGLKFLLLGVACCLKTLNRIFALMGTIRRWDWIDFSQKW